MIKNVQTGNIFFGIACGIIAAAACAAGWCWLRYKTEIEGGWMLLITGLITGCAVRFCGSGFTRSFSVTGALLTLLGGGLGKLLSLIGARAREEGLQLMPALDKFDYSKALAVLKPAMSGVDWLFIAVAVFIAYRISDKEESVWTEQ